MIEQKFCRVCGKRIEQPRTGRRRQTCSNACRQKLYRHRAQYRDWEGREARRIAREREQGKRRVRLMRRIYGDLHWQVEFAIERGYPLLRCRWCTRPYRYYGEGPIPGCCSRECRAAHRRYEQRLEAAIARARQQGKLDGQVLVRQRLGEQFVGYPRVPICAHCGLPFIPQGSFGPLPTYCSARCRRAAYERRYERRHRVKRRRRFRTCPVCGSRFDTTDARGYRQRGYCSKRCKNAAARRRARGLPVRDPAPPPPPRLPLRRTAPVGAGLRPAPSAPALTSPPPPEADEEQDERDITLREYVALYGREAWVRLGYDPDNPPAHLLAELEDDSAP